MQTRHSRRPIGARDEMTAPEGCIMFFLRRRPGLVGGSPCGRRLAAEITWKGNSMGFRGSGVENAGWHADVEDGPENVVGSPPGSDEAISSKAGSCARCWGRDSCCTHLCRGLPQRPPGARRWRRHHLRRSAFGHRVFWRGSGELQLPGRRHDLPSPAPRSFAPTPPLMAGI